MIVINFFTWIPKSNERNGTILEITWKIALNMQIDLYVCVLFKICQLLLLVLNRKMCKIISKTI